MFIGAVCCSIFFFVLVSWWLPSLQHVVFSDVVCTMEAQTDIFHPGFAEKIPSKDICVPVRVWPFYRSLKLFRNISSVSLWWLGPPLLPHPHFSSSQSPSSGSLPSSGYISSAPFFFYSKILPLTTSVLTAAVRVSAASCWRWKDWRWDKCGLMLPADEHEGQGGGHISVSFCLGYFSAAVNMLQVYGLIE